MSTAERSYLGQLLYNSLVQYGDTRAQQAKKLGVSENTVIRWAQGVTPRASSWHKLGLYLGIDPLVLKADCERHSASEVG